MIREIIFFTIVFQCDCGSIVRLDEERLKVECHCGISYYPSVGVLDHDPIQPSPLSQEEMEPLYEC